MTKLIVQDRFGIIPNALLNNPNISWNAKGLFGYIQSKPDNWDFAVERIQKDTKDGSTATNSGLRELENAGYLQRHKFKNNKWQRNREYILYNKPKENKKDTKNTENPFSVFGPTEKGQINKERIIKKEKENNNIIKENLIFIKQENLIKQKNTTPLKNIYYEFVKLTAVEYWQLLDYFQKNESLLKQKLKALAEYIGSKGDKYKSHYHTILMWERKNNPVKTELTAQEEYLSVRWKWPEKYVPMKKKYYNEGKYELWQRMDAHRIMNWDLNSFSL